MLDPETSPGTEDLTSTVPPHGQNQIMDMKISYLRTQNIFAN